MEDLELLKAQLREELKLENFKGGEEPLFSPFWVFMIKLCVSMVLGSFIGSLIWRLSKVF